MDLSVWLLCESINVFDLSGPQFPTSLQSGSMEAPGQCSEALEEQRPPQVAKLENGFLSELPGDVSEGGRAENEKSHSCLPPAKGPRGLCSGMPQGERQREGAVFKDAAWLG